MSKKEQGEVQQHLELKKKIGQHLRRLRTSKLPRGENRQDDVARALDMKQYQVSKAEAGDMSLNTMLSMFELYGVYDELSSVFVEVDDMGKKAARKARVTLNTATSVSANQFEQFITEDPDAIIPVVNSVSKELYRRGWAVRRDKADGQWYATSRETAMNDKEDVWFMEEWKIAKGQKR